MKKILSLLLALSMLLGCALLFTACSEKDGYVTLNKKLVEVDVTDYGVVYGDSMSDEAYTVTFTQAMADFATALSAKTGENYWARTEDRATTDKGDKEILIGLTSREESKKAHSAIKGDGFLIQVTENKIVIVGSSNLLTLMAVQYFQEKYLVAEGEESTVLSVHKKAAANNLEMALLADSEKGYYSFVHQAHLGMLTGAYMGTSSTGHRGPYKDHPQLVIDNMVQKMVDLTGLREKLFPIIKDSETAEKEILVGYPDREENRALLATLAENEYAVVVEGDKVHVTAWNDTLLINAAGAYMDILAEATVKNEDGTVTVALPQGFRLVRVGNDKWITDFPRPEGEGIELYNTVEDGENSLQFLYTGSGINAANYNAYCEKLKSEGYSVLMQSSAEDSIFTTFVNNKEGVSLYVAYNAYKHKNEFSAYDNVHSKVKTKDTNCYDFEECFRIASTPLEDAGLADSNLLNKNPVYDKVTDSMISTIPLYEGAVGLGYVVVLEDGRFIVFDGGAMGDNGDTHTRLWEWLTNLKVKITGRPVSSANPVHIAAWVLTHAHGDHYNAFMKMAEANGRSGSLKIDYMIGNFPQEYSCTTDIGKVITAKTIANMQNAVKGGFKFIKARTGQKYYLANLEIEVITTWADTTPMRVCDGNDTNTVLRFTMTNKDNPSEVVTQMWTGDANRRQSRVMCAMYGEYLKSDMVSIAHHGNVGLEIDFYDMVQPETVWWPHSAKAAHNYMNREKLNNGWQFQVDQHIAYEMPSVKYIYISGDKASTYAYYITLVLTKNGPDHDNIFDASTTEFNKLTHNGVFAIKK